MLFRNGKLEVFGFVDNSLVEYEKYFYNHMPLGIYPISHNVTLYNPALLRAIDLSKIIHQKPLTTINEMPEEIHFVAMRKKRSGEAMSMPAEKRFQSSAVAAAAATRAGPSTTISQEEKSILESAKVPESFITALHANDEHITDTQIDALYQIYGGYIANHPDIKLTDLHMAQTWIMIEKIYHEKMIINKIFNNMSREDFLSKFHTNEPIIRKNYNQAVAEFEKLKPMPTTLTLKISNFNKALEENQQLGI